MSVNYHEFYVNIINSRTKSPIDDDTGKFIVMTAGTSTLSTIYSDDNGTVPALVPTNITSTMTDGVIQFWTDSTVSTVDVSCLMADGRAFFIEGLTLSQHRFELDTESVEQTLILPIYSYIPTPFTSASITATGSVWGQGLSLPAGALTKDCFCRVETLGTAGSINLGVSATPSGLLQVISGDVTGLKWALQPDISGGTDVFAKGTLFIASTTGFVTRPWFTTGATGIVFSNVTVTTLAAMTGYMFIKYDVIANAT